MRKVIWTVLLAMFFIPEMGLSQPNDNGLYHFSFLIKQKSDIEEITQIISIDNVIRDTVFAYANQKEFDRFLALGIPYQLIPKAIAPKSVLMAGTLAEMANWDRYPTYDLYVQMMQNWESQYPDICKVEEIGTLSGGRKLISVKISDHPDVDFEKEPELFLTSSIHGDETGGYGVLLHLIDYLLSEYKSGNNPLVTQLVNNCEIWINPLANPNGSYVNDNSTLNYATRYNANYVDLNRNFPDPRRGDNPDGNAYQEETLFMMDFAAKHHFSLSVNIHGGSEVVNYPWDTWSKRTADDSWWRYVGGNYRDSAQANGPLGYMNDVSNGLTDGYDWYSITGGRQDYMNYFEHCREFTLEISGIKLYPATDLPVLWNSNRGALLGYMSEALHGLQGTITNSLGKPLSAKIQVLNHDIDSSEVYTDTTNGFYVRFLKQGAYSIKVSAPSYNDLTVNNINIIDGAVKTLNLVMIKPYSKLCIDTTSVHFQHVGSEPDTIEIPILNCGNQAVSGNIHWENTTPEEWLVIADSLMSLNPQDEKVISIKVNNLLQSDTVISKILCVETDTIIKIPVSVQFFSNPNLVLSQQAIFKQLPPDTIITDSVQVENLGNSSQHLAISSENINWLNTMDTALNLPAKNHVWLKYMISTKSLYAGAFSSVLKINNGMVIKIPVKVICDTTPLLSISRLPSTFELIMPDNITSSFIIENAGVGSLTYRIYLTDNVTKNIIKINRDTGSLGQASIDTISFTINSDTVSMGNYFSDLKIETPSDTITKALKFHIDSLPKFNLQVSSLNFYGTTGKIYYDSLPIENAGGDILTVLPKELITNNYSLLTFPASPLKISAKSKVYLPIIVDARNLTPGNYFSSISISGQVIPVTFTAESPAEASFSKTSIRVRMGTNHTSTDTIFISNIGGQILNFSVNDSQFPEWMTTNVTNYQVGPGETAPLVIALNSNGLAPQVYTKMIEIRSEKLYRISVTLEVEFLK